MEGMELWDAVETGSAERSKDRRALAVILRGVPPEMKCGLAVKKNMKDAWDAVKKLRAGDDRMKTASIQRLPKQFENLAFHDGESVGDFTMRINALIASLRELGEDLPDSRVVKKVLRVVPKRLKQVAVALEMLGDLDNMSIEELAGRLQVAEDADAEEQGQPLRTTPGSCFSLRRSERHVAVSAVATSGRAAAVEAMEAIVMVTTTAAAARARGAVGAATEASALTAARVDTWQGTARRRRRRGGRCSTTSTRSQLCCEEFDSGMSCLGGVC
jgi:hypothetical protein